MGDEESCRVLSGLFVIFPDLQMILETDEIIHLNSIMHRRWAGHEDRHMSRGRIDPKTDKRSQVVNKLEASQKMMGRLVAVQPSQNTPSCHV